VFYILSFFFGASIGSFVQVIVSRLHVAPIVKARSKCLSCGEALRAYDLIPFLSYFLVRGKCRYCKTPFGAESLFVETVYGICFVLLYITILSGQLTALSTGLYFLYYVLLFTVLGIIALYDKKHMYIPVSFLLSFCVLTLIMLCTRYLGVIHDGGSISMLLLGPVVTALPFLVLWIITRGKGVGFGDIILFLGVGAFFGIEQSIAVLILSVWIGAVSGVIITLLRKKKSLRDMPLPFVPSIVIAFLVVLFTDIDIFSIANTITGWYH
jgi:leader peptidase (prepilin peptidase)/N-methyltransferase